MASHHEMVEAHLQKVLLMEDYERAVVARIRQGGGVALAALQLCTSLDFHQVALGVPDHAWQVERAELVSSFAAAAATIIATVNVEDILHGGGQGPWVVPRVF